MNRVAAITVGCILVGASLGGACLLLWCAAPAQAGWFFPSEQEFCERVRESAILEGREPEPCLTFAQKKELYLQALEAIRRKQIRQGDYVPPANSPKSHPTEQTEQTTEPPGKPIGLTLVWLALGYILFRAMRNHRKLKSQSSPITSVDGKSEPTVKSGSSSGVG